MERHRELEELLNQWEDLTEEGQNPSAEEICRDRPELLVEFKQLVQKLKRLDGFLSGEAEEQAAMLLAAGRYQPIRIHAQGGIGDVFLAKDRELNRVVALKRIRMIDAFNAERCQRFQFEAQITGHLEHPGIVPVYGYERDAEGRFFYAMRLIQGDTLEMAIERFHNTYPSKNSSSEAIVAFQKLVRNFLAVCQTVGYAHSNGIIHRDLKPANIMVGKYGETLVVDWGLAKQVASDGEEGDESTLLKNRSIPVLGNHTLIGQIKGSPAYMSPEQAAGDTTRIGIASDIYSLGATLYSILTGQLPFSGKDLSALLDNVKAGKFSRPSVIRTDSPKALEAVCLKAMSLNPSDRYASPLTLANDIEHWLADDPVSAWREPWSRRAGRWIKRHRTLVATFAVASIVALVALGITGVILDHKNRELSKALTDSKDNFQQAHATWLNVVEFALDGQTLGDNVALDPIRLDILRRSITYGDGLRSRQPGNRQLVLETAFLHSALGEVESRTGDLKSGLKNCRKAIELLGPKTEDESPDFRHGRALSQCRLAQVLPWTDIEPSGERRTLLKDCCKELVRLTEVHQSGPTIMSFGKRNSPPTLLAESLLQLSELSPEERKWIEVVEDRLADSKPNSIRQELYAQSVRGQLWFAEAQRAKISGREIERVERACKLSRIAFERCISAEIDNREVQGSADIFRWFIAILNSIHAECLAKSGNLSDALSKLRSSCDVQQELLDSIEHRGKSMAGVWATIDPSLGTDATASALGPSSYSFRVQLALNLVELAELTFEHHEDAGPTFTRAEKVMNSIPIPTNESDVVKFQLATCQIRLAHFLASRPHNAPKARRLAQEASRSLDSIRGHFEAEFEISERLCQAYSILGALAMQDKSINEAIFWLEKTEPLRGRLTQPGAPMTSQILATRVTAQLAESLQHATPLPQNKLWVAAFETLRLLESLREQGPEGKEFADADIIRWATRVLAFSSLTQFRELSNQQPIPKEEIRRVCEPARNALLRLSKDAPPLANDESELLEVLENALNGQPNER